MGLMIVIYLSKRLSVEAKEVIVQTVRPPSLLQGKERLFSQKKSKEYSRK